MARKIALLLLLALAPLVAAEAQTRQSWLITQYSEDLDEARSAIQARVDDGYTPVGLEVAEGSGISVLYVDRPFADRMGWNAGSARLERFETADMEATERRMNSTFADGWFPVDISRSEEAFYILLLDLPWRVERFRFAYDMFTSERLLAAIEMFEEDGLALAGISLYEGVQIWYLFVESPDWQPERLYFTSYANDDESIVSGFNGDMSDGWIPAGFAVGTTSLTVHYVR